MIAFLLGAIAMADLAIGVAFLRFVRRTGDRFFGYFAAFFWIDAATRALNAFGGWTDDDPALYLLRLVGFVLIIIGVVDKNWARGDG